MLQIFQSTLPRVERQLSILAYSFPCQISIHAPASGATVTSVNIKLSFNISIHAPASGATVTSVNIKLSFNISIHAPASGATVNILKQNPNKVYFNPRSREWSDTLQSPISFVRTRFQSTLPRVERLRTCGTSWRVVYFNPRSREWSDGIY